jgi:hypothetical protein
MSSEFIDPEREDLPSASSIERIAACPGSHNLSLQVPANERLVGEAAEKGIRVHAAREAGDVSELELSEADLVSQMAQEEERIHKQWLSDIEINDAVIGQEKRFWLEDVEHFKKRFSAKVDFYAYSPTQKRLLILDRKSGRARVSPPTSNLQLRSSIVAIWWSTGLQSARVAIVQPFSKRQSPCDYNVGALRSAGEELDYFLNAAAAPNAPRLVGEHCKLCPARHICPEAQSLVKSIATLKSGWLSLPIEKRVELWKSAKLAVKIAEQIAANVKAELVANSNAYSGFLVKRPDQKPRMISDPIGVYLRLQELFPELPPNDLNAAFNSFCEMSVGAIEDWYREKKGGTKDNAKAWVNRELRACLGEGTRSGSVVEAEPTKK